MPLSTVKIEFTKRDRPAIETTAGQTLMTALLENGVPVASSCRGDGVCAKCRVRIDEGRKNLSPENSIEAFLRERHGFHRDERVSCQVRVLGNIQVSTDYW